jgi:hypothetical protein
MIADLPPAPAYIQMANLRDRCAVSTSVQRGNSAMTGLTATMGIAMQRARAALGRFKSEAGRTDEDGLQWPSWKAIRTASDFLDECQDRNVIFDSVVSDGVGGISLERRRGNSLMRVLIDEDGQAQFLRFAGTRLVDHRHLEAPMF